MQCPGCKQPARKLIIAFRGDQKIEGCENCFRARFAARVYTGRKVWTGDEVYGRAKCKEMARQFEDHMVAYEPTMVLRGPADFRRRR